MNDSNSKIRLFFRERRNLLVTGLLVTGLLVFVLVLGTLLRFYQLNASGVVTRPCRIAVPVWGWPSPKPSSNCTAGAFQLRTLWARGQRSKSNSQNILWADCHGGLHGHFDHPGVLQYLILFAIKRFSIPLKKA
jgi:hypothetical protein